jgi:hypothetical protein
MGERRGMVYIVDGSSGGQGGGGSLDHPVMFYSVLTPGSVAIDIDGLRMDARFISGDGTIDDWFTMIKGDYPEAPRPSINVARVGENAVIRWPTSVPDYRLEHKSVLDNSPWMPMNGNVITNGRRKAVMVPTTESRQFFQLKKVQ